MQLQPPLTVRNKVPAAPMLVKRRPVPLCDLCGTSRVRFGLDGPRPGERPRTKVPCDGHAHSGYAGGVRWVPCDDGCQGRNAREPPEDLRRELAEARETLRTIGRAKSTPSSSTAAASRRCSRSRRRSAVPAAGRGHGWGSVHTLPGGGGRFRRHPELTAWSRPTRWPRSPRRVIPGDLGQPTNHARVPAVFPQVEDSVDAVVAENGALLSPTHAGCERGAGRPWCRPPRRAGACRLRHRRRAGCLGR